LKYNPNKLGEAISFRLQKGRKSTESIRKNHKNQEIRGKGSTCGMYGEYMGNVLLILFFTKASNY